MYANRDTTLSPDRGFIPAHDPSEWDSLVVSALACPSTIDVSQKDRLAPGCDLGQITELCALLKDVLSTPDKYTKFLSFDKPEAQDMLDVLQKLLDHVPLMHQFHKLLYVALVRLCRKSELCPQSFDIGDVTDKDKEPRSRGTFGDVYNARYKGRSVCLKSVKVYQEQSNEADFSRRKLDAHKAFSREAVVWAQLSHVNILPFYGIHFFKDDTLCLVSPLIPNGNVHDFLKEKPNADRPRLISGVAAGMEYLHQNGVAHGDLKCLNVLVSKSGQALLTDFGFSYVTDNSSLQGLAYSSNHASGGTYEFEAPERVDSGLKKRRDGPSDVFAFGMLFYEMFTFPQIQLIPTIHGKIVYYQSEWYPDRPQDSLARGLTDGMWTLMKKCWSREPRSRPTATEIKRQLPLSPSSKDHQFNGRILRPGFEPGDVTITNALAHLRKLMS